MTEAKKKTAATTVKNTEKKTVAQKQENQTSQLEEVDLDSLNFEKKEGKTSADSGDTEKGVSSEKKEESSGEIEALKKEKGLKKMPVERDKDKRRVGKGMKKFIDNEVSPEMLEGMPEGVQELMKK